MSNLELFQKYLDGKGTLRRVSVRNVVEVEVKEGNGRDEAIRLVRYYFSTETNGLLAVHDECPPDVNTRSEAK